MTTDERTRRALERARENDSNNRDATRRVTSPAISGGSEATRSRTERALQSARQKDSQPRKLTPTRDTSAQKSTAPAITRTTPQSSASGQITSALDRFGDRGVVDTFSSADNWDNAGEAEAGLQRGREYQLTDNGAGERHSQQAG